MNFYAKVLDDGIVQGPQELPRSTSHISGFNLLDDATLKTHGWLPVQGFSYNNKFQNISAPDIQADKVVYTAVDKNIADVKTYLKSVVANLRWRKELDGYQYNDYDIVTDERSQVKMIGALLGIVAGVRVNNSKWKFKDGFKAVSNEDMAAICGATNAYIQSLYDKENGQIAEIEALETVADCKVYDVNSDWFPVDEDIF